MIRTVIRPNTSEADDSEWTVTPQEDPCHPYPTLYFDFVIDTLFMV